MGSVTFRICHLYCTWN